MGARQWHHTTYRYGFKYLACGDKYVTYLICRDSVLMMIPMLFIYWPKRGARLGNGHCFCVCATRLVWFGVDLCCEMLKADRNWLEIKGLDKNEKT